MDISEVLANEIAELEKQNPDWDREARVATVLDALRSGVPIEMLEGIYSPGICAEAQVILAGGWKMAPAAKRG